jgi:hypothetical protein
MNSREKILAISAFGVTGLLLVVFILTKVILGPTTEARMLANKVELDVEKLTAKNGMEPIYVDTLQDLTKRSYGDDPSTASEMSRAHIIKLISKAGLAGDDLSMTPVTGKTIKGGREVGWIIRIRGTQERLANLLYVFNADPHLHKLDNISWSPVTGSTDLSLQARFATLVLDPVEGVKPVPVNPEALVNSANVNSPERRWYALISDRDIFRPYIKRPPAPPPVRPPTTVRNETPRVDPPPVAPPASIYQLVGLPTWNNEVEVVVKNTRDGKATTHKIGESLIGGEIVMVDYRPLPLLKKPEFVSTSRVIVLIGREYYAVEIGQYLTDKYVVTTDRLPEALRGRVLPPPSGGSPGRTFGTGGGTSERRFGPGGTSPASPTSPTGAGRVDAEKAVPEKAVPEKVVPEKTHTTGADPGKSDPVKTEPGKIDSTKSEPGKAGTGQSTTTTTSDSTDTSGPDAPGSKPVSQEAGHDVP